jgi:hypothetical protein
MPAHFVTPQAPYSDPPGTAVTSGHHLAGRPAVSWAAALLACGLFVGVAAVAVTQGSDSVADTTASFVDPSRVPMKANANTQPPVPPTPVPVAPQGVPPVDPNAPQGLIGASPVPPSPDQAGAAANAPVVGGFAPVAVKRAAPQWKAAAAAAPAAKPAAKASAAPAAAPAAADDDAKEAKKETKKKKGADSADDETKKALEALQKAQLESASSFGN